jgi:redox-sensitive bicupin YhaK (pirin superfamily)
LLHMNPFLLVEEIGPVNLGAGDTRTAPPHPARGFEQITWMLEGSVTHHRASGSTLITVNQAEWISTGTGDLHREEFAQGNVRSLRIWISLPRLERKTPWLSTTATPTTDTLQIGTIAGKLKVDLLAGRLLGARAPLLTKTKATIARLQLPANTTFICSVDSIEPGLQSPTVLLYGLGGQAQIGPDDRRLLRSRELAILTPPANPLPKINSDEVRIRTQPGETFDVLWLSALPVGNRQNEPFIQWGSCIMRSEEEILQAIEDYRTGRFGTLAP